MINAKSLQNQLGDFMEDIECHNNSDCVDKTVNNCQNGFCLCGDHDPCHETADTCVNTKGGEIYDAICKCGQNIACSIDEICEKGKCNATKTNHIDSSTEDTTEEGKLSLISKIAGK